jgi:hypothetical protein
MLHVEGHRLTAHFVAFQAHGRQLRGLDHGACGGVAKAVNGPASGWRRPFYVSIGIHSPAQVNDLILGGCALAGQRQNSDVAEEGLTGLNNRDANLA